MGVCRGFIGDEEVLDGWAGTNWRKPAVNRRAKKPVRCYRRAAFSCSTTQDTGVGFGRLTRFQRLWLASVTPYNVLSSGPFEKTPVNVR